jgi:hypothetical protein
VDLALGNREIAGHVVILNGTADVPED